MAKESEEIAGITGLPEDLFIVSETPGQYCDDVKDNKTANKKEKPKSKKATVNEIITDRIIQKLDEGIVPWRKPWKTAYGGKDMTPKNGVSMKPYNGINRLLLWLEMYELPYWLTYKQAKDLKGHVNKGEKSSIVVFYTKKDRVVKVKEPYPDPKNPGSMVTHRTDTYWISRYYRVFNVEQCTLPNEVMVKFGAPEPTEPKTETERIQDCEELLEKYLKRSGVTLKHQDNRAYYQDVGDYVNLPKFENFEPKEEYYSAAYHEIVHSTGIPSRLDRPDFNQYHYTRQHRSKEELTAEIGACFLCAQVGIDTETFDNSTNYIGHWIEFLKNNPDWITWAGAKAQKAVDYINGVESTS